MLWLSLEIATLMRGKIPNVLIMEKQRSIQVFVQIVRRQNFLIDCVLFVDSTRSARSLLKKTNNSPLIGIDLLGGDFASPRDLFSTWEALVEGVPPHSRLYFFIRPDHRSFFDTLSRNASTCFRYFEVEQVIGMDEDPLLSVRRKKNSSMSIGMKQLARGEIDALISTGNTGALVANATLHLSLLPSISRLALLALLPTRRGATAVIDIGAHLHCTADQLIEFARMGICYQKSQGIHAPKIGLLNIGTEETKGHKELRKAYRQLQSLYPASLSDAPQFLGNIEGKNLFDGDVDLLVTDGFTGNIFLKTAEGISSFILDVMHQYKQVLPFTDSLAKRLEIELTAAKAHGAFLCGVDGLVIKCHGDAEPAALLSGIDQARSLFTHQSLSYFKKYL